jgi:hypothetical protein
MVIDRVLAVPGFPVEFVPPSTENVLDTPLNTAVRTCAVPTVAVVTVGPVLPANMLRLGVVVFVNI